MPDELTHPPAGQGHHDPRNDRCQAASDPEKHTVEATEKVRRVTATDERGELTGGQPIVAVPGYAVDEAHGEPDTALVTDEVGHPTGERTLGTAVVGLGLFQPGRDELHRLLDDVLG